MLSRRRSGVRIAGDDLGVVVVAWRGIRGMCCCGRMEVVLQSHLEKTLDDAGVVHIVIARIVSG